MSRTRPSRRDLAPLIDMIVARVRGLRGIWLFGSLARDGLLPSDLGAKLRGMVGFRNIAVHRYHQLDLRVLRSILDSRLEDLLRFAEIAIGLAGK